MMSGGFQVAFQAKYWAQGNPMSGRLTALSLIDRGKGGNAPYIATLVYIDRILEDKVWNIGSSHIDKEELDRRI